MAGLGALLALLAFSAYAYGREPAVSPEFAVPATPVGRAAPERPKPSRTAARPFLLSDPNGVSRWAPVVAPVTARAGPDASTRAVSRLGTRTPERTSNVVLLLQRVERRGRLWIQARLPVLPNNTVGWVPREALGRYRTVTTRLVVDRNRLNATLYRRGRGILRAPVGVGQSRWPTPAGRFYIRNKLTKFRNAFYGPVAFGTSARSPVLTDWPAGGFVGIHGTNRPELLPGRVSHGCIRMRNADIRRLARLMPPGTPLTIR